MDDNKTMTAAQAAEALGVCRRTVLRMIERGQLRGFRLNGYAMRVNADDVASVAATGQRADQMSTVQTIEHLPDAADEEARKQAVAEHLRRSVLYYRAKEIGLDVGDEPPQIAPELRNDLVAAYAGALAAIVEHNLHGVDADMLNPTPEARQIAAGLCDKAFDGTMPTLDDLHYTPREEGEQQ